MKQNEFIPYFPKNTGIQHTRLSKPLNIIEIFGTSWEYFNKQNSILPHFTLHKKCRTDVSTDKSFVHV